MALREGNRTFFVLYSNGDTFYFTVDSNSEIYCTRFKNIYEYNRKRPMPGAHILEFTSDSFSLKSKTGETIYSLDDYKNEMSAIAPTPIETTTIERLYIDEDVRSYLLSEGMIQYDEQTSYIPGLLGLETQEESTKGFARVRRPQTIINTTNQE